MNISHRQLKMFVVVATTLNYSKACRELCMSQSALSRAIQELESHLGTVLFNRNTRKMTLTESANRLLPHAQNLVRDIQVAIDSVYDKNFQLGGKVVMSASSSFVYSVLPKILRIFLHQHPQVKLTIIDDNSKGVNNRVINSEVDFGISSIFGDSHSLEQTKILTAPIGVVTNPQLYPLPTPLTINAISQFQFLRETNDSNVTQILRIHGSELINFMEAGVEVSSLGSQLAMIKAGVGISVVSALSTSHVYFSGLEFIPITPNISCEFFLINRKNNPLSAPAKAFVKLIKQCLPSAGLHPSIIISP